MKINFWDLSLIAIDTPSLLILWICHVWKMQTEKCRVVFQIHHAVCVCVCDRMNVNGSARCVDDGKSEYDLKWIFIDVTQKEKI